MNKRKKKERKKLRDETYLVTNRPSERVTVPFHRCGNSGSWTFDYLPDNPGSIRPRNTHR
jgi:hypothetical protein